jgi:very-short-patch-repair endonuclease
MEKVKSKYNAKYQSVDVCVPHIGLIIEYDGEQHFNPVRFGGISKEEAEEKLSRQMELDAIKK